MAQYSNNFDRVMEARNHFKDRASSKSQTSRRSVLRIAIIILFAAFVVPIILPSGVSVFAQDEICWKGKNGYIIDKSGKQIFGQIILHSSITGGEVWKDQFVISFSPKEKVDKYWARAKAREKKGKAVKRKFFLPDISTANLQGYGYGDCGYGFGDRKFVTKKMELDSGVKFIALEILSEEDKTYKFYDPNDNPSASDKYHIYREKPNGELERI